MIKTESLLTELFHNSQNIILVTDEAFSIRYITSNVESIFGVAPYSLLGKNAFNFAPVKFHEVWKNCIQQSLKNTSSEITLTTPDGKEVHFEVTFGNHVNHSEIRGVVIFLHDITDRKTEHQNLVHANNHLDHFIHKTVHDLQAPLQSALGLLDLAESSPAIEQERYLKMLKSSLQQLDVFMIELNSFFKNDKMAIQNVKVNFESIFNEELAINVVSLRPYPFSPGGRIKDEGLNKGLRKRH